MMNDDLSEYSLRDAYSFIPGLSVFLCGPASVYVLCFSKAESTKSLFGVILLPNFPKKVLRKCLLLSFGVTSAKSVIWM